MIHRIRKAIILNIKMHTFLVIFATVITFALGSSTEESDEAPKLAHVSYKDGDSVTVTCPFDSEGQVTWSRNNLPVDEALLIEGTDINKYVVNQTAPSTLKINRVSQEDAGNYTCRSGDQIDSTAVEAAPRFVNQHMKSVTVIEGADLEHFCSLVWAYPKEVVVTWYKGDTLLENDYVKIFITDDTEKSVDFGTVPNGKLEIKSMTMEDRDDYKCKVDNGAVVVEHTVLVRVRSKLAPLWPFLGILLEVVILIAIIVIWERNQKKKREEDKNE